MGKIGIFDSGYGGLTILSSIHKVLPQYDYIYLGDNARTPYGNRSFDVVYRYTLECVKKLFELNCELVILACNTASAKALRTIQQNDLPHIAPEKRVLGIIRPTVEALGKHTRTGYVGLLATPGTVQSNSYPLEIQKLYNEQIKIASEECPMWVPLIENNEYNSRGADFFIRQNVKSLREREHRIDTVILGCTHYQLIYNKLRDILPVKIEIVSQGEIVAKSLADYLLRHPEIETRCDKYNKIQYFTTESKEKFASSASIFLNSEIVAEHIEI
ncbi:MAG: glutamate racemase [Paludibacter sp.]|jgi:glutamate racemase|nr:glutamate racemase [Paludibacter sp.]